jgi:hypothetical protein
MSLRTADAPGLTAASAPGGTFGRRSDPDGASEAWQATHSASSMAPPAARSTRREMAGRLNVRQLSLSTQSPVRGPSQPASPFNPQYKTEGA